MIEKHAHIHFHKFLTTYNLIHQDQSVFRKIHSCETALAKMVAQWASNMNDGQLTGLVLPDLRKAFDMVNHDILIVMKTD